MQKGERFSGAQVGPRHRRGQEELIPGCGQG